MKKLGYVTLPVYDISGDFSFSKKQDMFISIHNCEIDLETPWESSVRDDYDDLMAMVKPEADSVSKHVQRIAELAKENEELRAGGYSLEELKQLKEILRS